MRLFNPFVLRWPKVLGYAFDFQRTNRRMHNKSLTADNQASIVGGRNIGNEYFGNPQGVLFADLDVLAWGPVVRDISHDFDRYWASPSAYPIERIVTHPYALDRPTLRQRIATAHASTEGQRYQAAKANSRLPEHLQANDQAILWAPAHLVSDDPAKVLGQARQQGLIGAQLARAIGQPSTALDMVSPYFVPTQAGLDALAQLRAQGIRIRVLTNALEATDVSLVHVGYARYRAPCCAWVCSCTNCSARPPLSCRASCMNASNAVGYWPAAAPACMPKPLPIDGQRAFVGSFNFDPRSMLLNTEMGLVIESPALAAQISNIFEQDIPWRSYRLSLDPEGHLQWEAPLLAVAPRTQPSPTPAGSSAGGCACWNICR